MRTRANNEVRVVERSAREVPGGRRLLLDFDADGERLPAILLAPDAAGPAPSAVLLHGYTSHKERMAESVGRALLARGIASLSLDLPLHGERQGALPSVRSGQAFRGMRSPFEVARQWKAAVRESRLAARWLAAHPALDPDRVALVGYSLGSFVGVCAAAEEPLVRAVVLAAGGDLPTDLPFGALVRTIADPARAVRRLEGRPLLMVNGRLDRTVRPEQAERLFAAARGPKEIRWYGGGHWPPATEIDAVGEWVSRSLREESSAARRAASRE